MSDIDMHMSPEAPGAKRASSPLLTVTTTKRVKLEVSQDELTFLYARFNRRSRFDSWATRLQQASGDPPGLTRILSEILNCLLILLALSTLRDSFISPLLLDEVERLVEGFNADELREWEDRAKMCMESGDWGKLITHPRLQPVAITPNKGRPSSETMEERSMRLHAMFSRKYRGDFHKLLVAALDDYHEIYDPTKHFGRVVPIIQSSGTGKSRLVSEMANEVPTLSVCFRESPLVPDNGWPPADIPARNLLLRHDKRFKAEELAAAFLGAVMAVVASKIEAQGDSAPQEGDWMYDWRLDSATNIASSRRHTYFVEVAAAAEDLLGKNTQGIVNTRVSYEFEDLTRDDSPNDSAPDWHTRLFTMLCLPSFAKLSRILKEREVKWFILAFDECSELNRTKSVSISGAPDQLSCTPLVALKRIIKAYDDFVDDVPIWFLLLDTDSSIIDVSPLSKETSSDRFVKDPRSLPPWPNVGFNQMAEKNVFADKKKLPTDVHSVQHLKLYGRPYWSTLTDGEVLHVASKKLFPDKGFKAYQEDHVFAAFAVRVGLEIGVGEASERLAMEAVRSHLRVLETMVDFRVITTSPPEPMLAIAAAVVMNHSEETYKTALKTLLDTLILKGIVLDRGLLGQLPSRLLLLRARDKATLGGIGCIDDLGEPPKVLPVQLSKFLKTLLGNTLGLPDEQSDLRAELLQEASSVWINFTHFYQLPHSIDVATEPMLVNAWSTGAAFQCAHNQPVIDGFIVAYHGPLDKPFQSSCLITIPWLAKAKSAAAAASALAHSSTARFIFPQNGGGHHKPWQVVIHMDLAASPAFGKAKGPRCELTCAKVVRPKRGEEGQEADERPEGKKYGLHIRGHRSHSYPVLEGLEKQFDVLFTRALNISAPELVPYMEEMEKAKNCMILD